MNGARQLLTRWRATDRRIVDGVVAAAFVLLVWLEVAGARTGGRRVR